VFLLPYLFSPLAGTSPTYRTPSILRFALDLVEVYFQVVHTRLPFLNPTHFRARLNVNVPQYASIYVNNSASSAEETLHPALMATVVAWGAKFSEHPLLVADRLNSPARQSGLAKTLIVRAREVAEALKVHRVPAAEHVVIALLIEPLQSRALDSLLCTVMHGGSCVDTSLFLWLPETPDDANGQCIYPARGLQKAFSC